MSSHNDLQINMLGELELRRGGRPLPLPPSRKTRALLVYLVATGRSHRRERLCSLLWDVADDPRAALRWSLSKLRQIVDDDRVRRIVSDRDSVAFQPELTEVDLFQVRERLREGPGGLTTGELLDCAGRFRGELVEGLELPGFFDYEAWCTAEREQARRLRGEILGELVKRAGDRPEEALPHARTRVAIDPMDEAARAELIELLGRCRRVDEAEQHYRAAHQIFAELGTRPGSAVEEAWRAARTAAVGATRVAGVETPAAAESEAAETPASAAAVVEPGASAAPVLVGRNPEWERLRDLLGDVTDRKRRRIVVLTGEPGVGKTRLLTELADGVQGRGGTVLRGAAFEAEAARPYGPWLEALARVRRAELGDTLLRRLAPLLDGVGPPDDAEGGREQLFGAVVALLDVKAHSAPPVVLCLDDIQWMDDASASLLHYVTRLSAHRPLLVALAAREGELADNEAAKRLLRGWRREGHVEEIALGPLDAEATSALLEAVAPGSDATWIHEESAGNPLFALELARAQPQRDRPIPPTLTALIRDRVNLLPSVALDVLRWASVWGGSVEVRRLAKVVGLDATGLMPALELLERHALLVADPGASGTAYRFAHDVVRSVVYGSLSDPIRRVMHEAAARGLEAEGSGDSTNAPDIAFHAALAGDDAMAAGACVAAGQQCLRVFAGTEALTYARRGRRHAQRLPEPASVELSLELSEIEYAARRPANLAAAAREVGELAERALDLGRLEHARLGFHIVSYLRWEGGEWTAAQRQTMRAEFVSRAADDKQRLLAMAEAARCLALLERDLVQAEALALEAGALSARVGVASAAVADAQGLLMAHRGELDDAQQAFQTARLLYRRDGDRLGEFQALEHATMLELQRDRLAEALPLANELLSLGQKLREGSERAFAQALLALVECSVAAHQGEIPLACPARSRLDEALQSLRVADSKHRLVFALTYAAAVDLAYKDPENSRRNAEEALQLARYLERPSETALAQVALVRSARALADEETWRSEVRALQRQIGSSVVSQYARCAVEAILAETADE